MVAFKEPVQVTVGITPGFTPGQTTATLDGSGIKQDWRGLALIVDKPGFGPQFIPENYTWDKATGEWINAIPFQDGEKFFVEFQPKEIIPNAGSIGGTSYGFNQYPHIAIIDQANWYDGSGNQIQTKCRISQGEEVKRGFNVPDASANAIVYFPLPIDTIDLGTQIEIRNGEQSILSGPVKQFSRGLLNARIWM